MIVAALALALALEVPGRDASAIDPAEPANEPTYPAAPALDESAARDAEADPADGVVRVDPLVECKQMLLDSRPGDADRLGDAHHCFRMRALDTPPDSEQTKRALAMAEVVGAWRLVPSNAGGTASANDASTNAQLSMTRLVESGRAEAMLQGALGGAVGGFLLTSTIVATTRASEQDTLPWLIASPALGAVAGTAGAWALVDWAEPTKGDISFAASTMWTGAAEGFLVQLAVFSNSREASAAPLRFLTVLGGGAVGLASGVGLAPLVDVTEGDAAVANSALLWGGVMSGFGLAFASANGVTLGSDQVVPVTTLVLAVGSTVPYVAVLAAHPLVKIERWPSLLIEAGGVAGLLVGGAMIVATNGSGVSIDPRIGVALLGGATLGGVVAGTAAAHIASEAARPSGTVDAPRVTFAPTLLPDLASSSSRVMPGVAASGRF